MLLGKDIFLILAFSWPRVGEALPYLGYRVCANVKVGFSNALVWDRVWKSNSFCIE